MTIAIAPTLELMADVYRQPTIGGRGSRRIRAYVDAGMTKAPVHGYNPMTSKPVLDAVEALIGAGAEERLAVVANEAVRHLGYDRDEVMYFTVATPGMWTDRLGTEVEHRLLAKDPGCVLWWFDEPVDLHALDSELVAQTARLVCQRRGGPPATLASAAHQEGLAGAMAGEEGRFHAAAAEAFEVLGGETRLSTMVAVLYGDRAALEMGFTPVGLGDWVGYRHAIALEAAARTDE